MDDRLAAGTCLFLMMLLAAATRCVSAEEAAKPVAKGDFELVLGLWPPQAGKYPVRIAIRNLRFQEIPSAQCMGILGRCVLHVSQPDGSQSSKSLGVWRGRAPDDISRGDLASHCINTPVDGLFKMKKEGRYILWWTQGGKRSNSLAFERDGKELRRLP